MYFILTFLKTHIVILGILLVLIILFIIFLINKKKKKRDGYIERFVPQNEIRLRDRFKNRKGNVSYKNDVKKERGWASGYLDDLGVIGDIIKSIIELFKGVGEIFEGFGGGGSGGSW